jgi:hypothetical protein
MSSEAAKSGFKFIYRLTGNRKQLQGSTRVYSFTCKNGDALCEIQLRYRNRSHPARYGHKRSCGRHQGNCSQLTKIW